MGSQVDQTAGLSYSLKAQPGVKFSVALQERVMALLQGYCTAENIEVIASEANTSVIVVTMNALTLPKAAAVVLKEMADTASSALEDKYSDIMQQVISRMQITDSAKISKVKAAWDAFMRTVESISSGGTAPTTLSEASSSSMDAIERRKKHRDEGLKGRLPGQVQSMPQLLPQSADPANAAKRAVPVMRPNANPGANAGTYDAGNVFNHGHRQR